MKKLDILMITKLSMLLIPILQRRNPHDLGEHAREVIRILYPQLACNFIDAKRCELKVLTGMLNF